MIESGGNLCFLRGKQNWNEKPSPGLTFYHTEVLSHCDRASWCAHFLPGSADRLHFMASLTVCVATGLSSGRWNVSRVPCRAPGLAHSHLPTTLSFSILWLSAEGPKALEEGEDTRDGRSQVPLGAGELAPAPRPDTRADCTGRGVKSDLLLCEPSEILELFVREYSLLWYIHKTEMT